MGDNWKVHFWKKKKRKKRMAFLFTEIIPGILDIFGDDGDKRPTPQQMARATAIKGRENEIRQDMAKFFKKMKEEMSDAFKKMDADGNGFLSKDEIEKVMEENSKTWGHVDDETFDQVDLNDDGKIYIDEFLKWSLGE